MSHRFRIGLSVLVGLIVLAGPAPGQQTDKKQPAYLKIFVPADCKWGKTKLKIDDTATTQTGTTRNFISPPLTPGKRYVYTLTVVFVPNNNYTTITRKREVIVAAGKTAEVDMTVKNDKFPDEIVIRWVPTPWEVIYKMLELAEVKDGEVVWDLGCGDGRIPVAAVEKFKAKSAFGADIDPKRIKEANELAKERKVVDKIEFKVADVLKIDDFSPANVVTLYMGNELNEAVRPMLQKTLKPGSRIVSHRFVMGNWKPDKSITFTHDGQEYKLHLWRIGTRKEDRKEEKKEER